ncbi:hypothetical protein [Chondromyces apiculatus]|uniref:Uncharacterized protein n=1 Tax=Chondromyces apiculatus DSM 436 TaxID=1192034 RepID=A0A017TDV3_9BACT|nr:hypothetical protein [Chondromyces apiculatus]EYF07062.1 Hypothetical protein CAP_1321 [Chondromyces apiculatus DSM 436]
MPLLDIETDLDGCVASLCGLALTNQVDASKDEAIRRALTRLVAQHGYGAPAGSEVVRCRRGDVGCKGVLYELDQGPDRWSNWRAALARAAGGVIVVDCEDLSAAGVAGEYILAAQGGYEIECELRITQPEPGAIAHAYYATRRPRDREWRIVDLSVATGMADPGSHWYERGQTSRIPVPQLILT